MGCVMIHPMGWVKPEGARDPRHLIATRILRHVTKHDIDGLDPELVLPSRVLAQVFHRGFTIAIRLYSHTTMDDQKPLQVVELRISYRYTTAHPWVVQGIGGFLSAYYMEHPGFRVQRHIEELESGTHLWVCEVPQTMTFLRLLKRLKEDIPPCHTQQIPTDLPGRFRYFIDCPTEPEGEKG